MNKDKHVFKFGNRTAEGNAKMKNLLGGKGANLAEMNLIGVPVPAGFTITTEVCNDYYVKGREATIEAIKAEVEDGVRFLTGHLAGKVTGPVMRRAGILPFGTEDAIEVGAQQRSGFAVVSVQVL